MSTTKGDVVDRDTLPEAGCLLTAISIMTRAQAKSPGCWIITKRYNHVAKIIRQ